MTRSDLLLAGLDESQVRAVTTPSSTVVVLAGAGSGKTRVLTRRIAWRAQNGDAEPKRVLAVTFTRKAARELTGRLRSLNIEGPRTGTFHAFAYSMLREYWVDTRKTPPSRVIGSKSAVLVKLPAVRALLKAGKNSSSAVVRDLATEIEWSRVRMVPPESYIAASSRRTPAIDPATTAAIYGAYEDEKRRRSWIDFEDMLSMLTESIEQDPYLAAELRAKWRHVLVDEFQDVNPLQFKLLMSILGENNDLFAVGDPNQAIYSFAGADANYLTTLGDIFDSTETIHLSSNYRSSNQIVRLANEVFTPTGAPSDQPEHPRAARQDGPIPSIWHAPSSTNEATRVAREVRDAFDARSGWGAGAILFRTAAQSGAFESALTDLRVPYVVRGDAAFLRRPEVAAVVNSLLATPQASGIPIYAHVAEIVEQSPAEGEEKAALEALIALAHDFDEVAPFRSTGRTQTEEFIAWLRNSVASDLELQDPASGVNLLTLHSAKGLEFRSVWLVGLERGLFPIHYAKTREQLNEERRLFYVGITRASQRLTLTWAENRTFKEREIAREKSPFLDEIEGVLREMHQSEKSTQDWGARSAELRRSIQVSASK